MDAYSPIDRFLEKHGAEFTEVESVKLPLHYASGIQKEFETLYNQAGVLDLKAFHLIQVEGPEAENFLQRMVSNDLEKLEPGRLQANLLSTHKGKILFQLELYKQSPETFIILCNAGEGPYVGGYLDHYHIQEDLEMTLLNPQWSRCDLIGPKAQETIESIGGQPGVWNFESQDVITISHTLGGVPRLINLIPTSAYIAFLEVAQKQTCLVGVNAFEQVRVAERVPRYGIDYTRDNFPQEAALSDHISYSKGCYIGQETHARMYHRGHPNWQSVAIEASDQLDLQAEQELFFEQKAIGRITSLCQFSLEGKRRGIAFIKYEQALKKVALSSQSDLPASIQQFPLATA